VEAIHHAQAAQVPIVVALNKIDLGDQNKLKIFGQLSEHRLTPSGDWGGETDVIETSAVTGKGITELVEHLADLSSLLELKADPTLPARGTVIEAETKAGVGSVVRILVQEGTLRVGDFVVCGNAFGKVRALKDDRGGNLPSAGPGTPVEVWGLDDVPVSGDALYAVDNLQRAKEIASETRRLRVEESRVQSRKVKSLAEMFAQRTTDEIPELNIIIKADVDGSLAALRHALAEIPSDEVRLGIRHAAVGGVNDSDILLAATAEAIIVAFRVDTSVGAKRLAEQHGVDVRQYRVIYDVVDDIRKALSGLLTPDQRIEEHATVDVRQIFRVSKVGLVAGCYVSQGTVERNHLAKVVRDGVVVREGARIGSLRHLKDDVREVRAGMECGIRLDGFDDIHVGDRIETYEVVEIARSL
jgi:translation initiation factor IF-2